MMLNRWKLGCLVASLGLVIASDGAVRAQMQQRESNPDKITVYVPALASDSGALGESVATILSLQIWRTLRKQAPCPKPGNSLRGSGAGRDCANPYSFGEGNFRWTKKPLDEPTHEAAARVAEQPDFLAQMVLWGKTSRYGRDIVVLAFLTLPDFPDRRTRRFEKWALKLNVDGKSYDVVSDLPARKMAFEPIVLTEKVVSNYSRPAALKLYRTADGRGLVGFVAPPILFALWFEDNAIRVRSGKTEGWVVLPDLATVPSEVVSFVGGVMRIYRADWDGALALLKPVAESRRTPTELQIDSLLLMGRASYQVGGDFESYLLKAEALNPIASRVVRYRVMGMLAQLQRADPAQKASMAKTAKDYLAARARLFDPDDEWFRTAGDVLAALAPQ